MQRRILEFFVFGDDNSKVTTVPWINRESENGPLGTLGVGNARRGVTRGEGALRRSAQGRWERESRREGPSEAGAVVRRGAPLVQTRSGPELPQVAPNHPLGRLSGEGAVTSTFCYS